MGRGPVCYYVDFVSYKPDESFDLVNSRSLLGDWRYYRCWRELFLFTAVHIPVILHHQSG